jgi:hypothetical protein
MARAKSIEECIDIGVLSSVLFFLIEKSLPREDSKFKFSLSSSWLNNIIEFLKVTHLASPLDLYKVSN